MRYVNAFLIFVSSIVFSATFSIGVVRGTQPYLRSIADTYGSQIASVVPMCIVLLTSLVFTGWYPQFFGWCMGKTFVHRKSTLVLVIAPLVIEVVYLGIAGRIPFYGVGWTGYIISPIGEEILYRGFLFSLLCVALRRNFSEVSSQILAIFFSAIAFSGAHLVNIGRLPMSFLFFQLCYTFVLGIILGVLRTRTGSLYPPMLLHIGINFLAVAL